MALEDKVILHRQRRMVGKPLVFVNRCALRCLRQGGRGQVVVDAPAHVVGPGLAAVAPPGVGLRAMVGVQVAVHVRPAVGQ